MMIGGGRRVSSGARRGISGRVAAATACVLLLAALVLGLTTGAIAAVCGGPVPCHESSETNNCMASAGSHGDDRAMTTLITGGTGLIGTTLAEQLLSGGERVVLFDVALPEARVAALRRHGERLRLVRGDVQALGEMISVIRAEKVEAIVHLAFVLGGVGNAEPERASRVNVMGTVNALEAARLTGVPRVILASSIAVYGSGRPVFGRRAAARRGRRAPRVPDAS